MTLKYASTDIYRANTWVKMLLVMQVFETARNLCKLCSSTVLTKKH